MNTKAIFDWRLYLNVEGTLDDASDELKAFLDYAAGKKPKDAYVEKLDEAVKEAKKNREWRLAQRKRRKTKMKYCPVQKYDFVVIYFWGNCVLFAKIWLNFPKRHILSSFFCIMRADRRGTDG